MKIKKIFWALRLLFYKPFFGRVKLPGYLGKPLFISRPKGIKLGRRVRIYPGARLEIVGNGTIDIGDNVSIAQNFHCTSCGNLVIGNNTTISGNVFVTNIDHEYREIGVHILNQPLLLKETRIGDNCFIGFGASIQAGTILGKQCIVGTNAVVRGVFPDYSVIVGVPARIVKVYDHESKSWIRYNGKQN